MSDRACESITYHTTRIQPAGPCASATAPQLRCLLQSLRGRGPLRLAIPENEAGYERTTVAVLAVVFLSTKIIPWNVRERLVNDQ